MSAQSDLICGAAVDDRQDAITRADRVLFAVKGFAGCSRLPSWAVGAAFITAYRSQVLTSSHARFPITGATNRAHNLPWAGACLRDRCSPGRRTVGGQEIPSAWPCLGAVHADLLGAVVGLCGDLNGHRPGFSHDIPSPPA